MRTFKALLTGVAITAISTILAVSAFAADPVTYEDGKLIASGYTKTEGQMTALVVEATKWDSISDASPLTAGDILYINQFAMEDADTILTNMGIKGELVEDTTYYVLIGGENANSIQKLEITYTTSAGLAKGDADTSGIVNESDAVTILDYCLELITFTDAQMAAADVDGSGIVNESDAVDILDYCLELPSYVGGDK